MEGRKYRYVQPKSVLVLETKPKAPIILVMPTIRGDDLISYM